MSTLLMFLSMEMQFLIYIIVACFAIRGLYVSGGLKKWPVILGVPAFCIGMLHFSSWMYDSFLGILPFVPGHGLIADDLVLLILWLFIVAANALYTLLVKPKVVTRFYEMFLLGMTFPFFDIFFGYFLYFYYEHIEYLL